MRGRGLTPFTKKWPRGGGTIKYDPSPHVAHTHFIPVLLSKGLGLTSTSPAAATVTTIPSAGLSTVATIAIGVCIPLFITIALGIGMINLDRRREVAVHKVTGSRSMPSDLLRVKVSPYGDQETHYLQVDIPRDTYELPDRPVGGAGNVYELPHNTDSTLAPGHAYEAPAGSLVHEPPMLARTGQDRKRTMGRCMSYSTQA